MITSGGSVYSSLTYSPYGETPAILEKVRAASWYQRLSGIIYPSRRIITEENLLLPRNGEDQIYFVSNITDGRTNYGVLMIGINRSYFSGLLENFKPTENSLSCLYSADTAIWNDATLLDGSGPESFPDTGDYTEIIRDVPGVGESGWKLASFIPRDDISKESRSILVLGIVLVGFAALCTVLLIVVINRAVVLPVSQLSGLMRQVQDGRLDVRAQIRSHDEIGNLGAGFNSMVSRLKENIEQIQEEENSKRELELKMLQAQIDPHFIRNTLNTIRWMAELRKATGISRALSSFIRLMDYSFRSRAPAVTVREECEYLQEYIYLQKLRYQNRFEFTLHADEELLDVPILRLLVQPLLENSLVHGLAEKDGFGNLSVDFCREEDRMCVCVRDDGVGYGGADGAGADRTGRRAVRKRPGKRGPAQCARKAPPALRGIVHAADTKRAGAGDGNFVPSAAGKRRVSGERGERMRVLVVDDEPLARIGMRSIVPWEENGFTLVGGSRKTAWRLWNSRGNTGRISSCRIL